MRIDLEELVISASGLPVEQARSVGEAVAQRLGEALAKRPSAAEIGALDLRIQITPGMSTGRIVEAITDALLARIG